MYVKRLIVTGLLFFMMAFAYSQDYTIVEIEGEKYYSHKVEAGHTLYAIASLYNSDEEIILEYNKETLTEGLKVGQTIYVPVHPDFEPGKVTNPIRIEDGFLVHRVLRKETLFSICQKYTVDINDVVDLNPNASNGLKKGEELRIPVNDVNSEVKIAPPVQFEKNEWTQHTVLPGETLYGVSKKYNVKISRILELNNGLKEGLKAGDVINIPLKIEERDEEPPVREIIAEWEKNENPKIKDSYKVALALPFYLSEYDTAKLSMNDKRVRRVALNFYRGAAMAANVLSEENVNIELEVLSVSDSRGQVKTMPSEEKFHEMDMFIGPFQKEALKKVIEITKNSQTPVICPTPQSGSMLLSNPNVFKVLPSGSTLMENSAKHLAAKKNKPNIILIQTDWVNDKRRQQVFEKEYYAALGDSISANERKLKIIPAGKLTLSMIRDYLSESKENIIVMPSEQKVSIGKLVNILPILRNRDDITVYLTKKWLNDPYINADFVNQFSVHYTTFFSESYDSDKVKEFEKGYKLLYDDYATEYSILGFDVMLYFGRALKEYGLDFPVYINQVSKDGLVDSVFNFNQVGPDSGFENEGAHILYFQDFELIAIKP